MTDHDFIRMRLHENQRPRRSDRSPLPRLVRRWRLADGHLVGQWAGTRPDDRA